MLKFMTLVATAIVILTAGAQAHTHHHGHHHYRHHHRYRVRHAIRSEGFFEAAKRTISGAADVVSRYLPHPPGCPRVAFCGCGAAAEVGRAGDRSLWQARSWFRFPRAAPAPGMAAVRTHHVFVLREHLQGDVWLVADHNSGHHMSRLHERSIAGYRIVNPS